MTKDRRKRIRKARHTFPKIIAAHAEQTAKVMAAKKMTTAHYVFEGAMGDAMILVTLDPKVVEAVALVLEALGGEIKPADEIETPAEKPELIALKGGVATLALQGAVVPDDAAAPICECGNRRREECPVHGTPGPDGPEAG